MTTAVEAGESNAYGAFAYSEQIASDTIKVTFNGTEYTCNKTLDGGDNLYGGEWSDATESFDFSTYPFAVASSGRHNYLYTETAGTYQIKIETVEKSVEISECFENAVKKASSGGSAEPLIVELVNNQTNLTAKEINDAFRTGRRVIMLNDDNGLFYHLTLKFITPTESGYMSDWEGIATSGINLQTGAITYQYRLLSAPSENDPYSQGTV